MNSILKLKLKCILFLYFIIHYIHKCKGEGKVHEYATYL